MEVLVKYRTPTEEHITLEVSGKEYELPLLEYINIIRPCSRVEGSGKAYLECRKKLIFEYLENIDKLKDDNLFKW